jgi:ADP-heptose:LPS heptosyltransferase
MNLNVARYVDKWVGLPLCLALFALERVRRGLGGRPVPSLLATTPPSGEPPPAPRRILCMKFYGLGNMVILMPVLAAIRARYPDAEIDFMTMPGNTTLLERSGTVTNTIAVDTSTPARFLASFAGAMRRVRARRYDVVIDFEQFVKISCLIGYLSGAPERIGFNTDGQRRGFTYTTRVVYTDSDHMTDIFARLIRPLGITGPLPVPTLPLTERERGRADAFLAEHGVAPGHAPLVAIHLGIGMNFYRVPLKRWDPANFAAVADALIERFGAAVVFTGQGDEERDLVATARATMRHPAVDATNRFSVTELAALLSRAHLVVSNDTSVMHLAALMGTPVAALFGPTAPLHYGPRGDRHLVFYRDLYCSPCLTNYNLKISRCLDPVCMRGITPEAVVSAIAARYLEPNAPLRATRG